MRFEKWLENGTVYINGKKIKNFSEIPWSRHQKFEGVFMKNLFCGLDSDNNLSSMIVKIEPHHEIGNHIHEGKSELHEILAGKGIGTVGDKKIDYCPGVVSFIPADIPHKITAGEEEMIILAKFTPPLN
ncbi:MAG TPA: cupin domain-containing protein [bacterium]|nr:cupin domain-containing protein [bacterium]